MADRKRTHKSADIGDLLARLAGEEQQFLAREFLAPAQRGGTVSVRIGGAVCTLHIDPAEYEGWGVFQPLSFTRARFVRPATLTERRRYLDLFPLARLIVVGREGPRFQGCTANAADRRLQIDGLVPIVWAQEVQTFDLVRSRWDGSQFWFDELDPVHSAATAAYLREALSRGVPPDQVQRPGLTPEERSAYEVNYWRQVAPADPAPTQQAPRGSTVGTTGREPTDPVRRRLHESLSHAGARLIDYLERGDSYRVTYEIDGHSHTSAVDKRDLTVQASGICLDGRDQDFDLASLVGVLREGARGGGTDYDD